MDAQLQSALVGVVAGIVAHIIQRAWQAISWLPVLSVDSATLTKRIAAILLAAVAGYSTSGGDLQKALSAALTAFLTSQTLALYAPQAKTPVEK
jgi:hypothetical protein